MKRDYAVTFATEFLVLASGILIYKLAARALGIDGFAAYALCRRTLYVIYPLVLLGFGSGIPRYVAYAGAAAGPASPDGYFLAGAAISGAMTLAAVLICQLFAREFAFLFFGDRAYATLILPLNLMIAGITLHVLCYSYFRGRLAMMKANALQLVNLAVVPLAAFAVFGRSTSGVLAATGLAWLAVAAAAFAGILARLRLTPGLLRSQARELCIYSLQRLPGDFGLSALIALPGTFAAHAAGLKEGGGVAFGYSLLSMAGTAFAPIGLILLPQAARMIAKGDLHTVKSYARRILALAAALTGFGILVFELFAERIIRIYLGPGFENVAAVVRPILFGALAYAIYVAGRSVLDAYYVKAMNTKNILIALAAFLAFAGLGSLLGLQPGAVIAASLISFYLLAGLTLIDLRKIGMDKSLRA